MRKYFGMVTRTPFQTQPVRLMLSQGAPHFGFGCNDRDGKRAKRTKGATVSKLEGLGARVLRSYAGDGSVTLPPITGVVTRPRIRSKKEPAVIASNPSVQLPFALASSSQGRSFENIKLPAPAVSQFSPQHSTVPPIRVNQGAADSDQTGIVTIWRKSNVKTKIFLTYSTHATTLYFGVV
ncbi:hypothetical protein EDB86DRAFT_2828688 [Lactarius hatsudake]|nr:hypothetical protein EDB86DRAFT_2828688 [Lactarius hatsudake]